jgi:hypothetical protein
VYDEASEYTSLRLSGHISDLIWYIRLVDSSLPRADWDALPLMDSLTSDWPELQRKWEAWAGSLAGSDLEHVVQYKLLNGSPGETPGWQIVVDVVNHATLHRGQVVAMLRQWARHRRRRTFFGTTAS